jgi:hypothetical protein
MAASLEVAGDIAAAGGALAGLVLVFLAAVSTDFFSIPAENRHFVLGRYQVRAWFAFVGLALCLASVGMAIVAKRLGVTCLADTSIIALMVALAWVLAAGLMTVKGIK